MTALRLAAVWAHLASGVLLTGAFYMLLLAGPPATSAARRWDRVVLSLARVLVLSALVSGIAWLMLRTAAFEGRAHAALEAHAVLHAVLDTWPGLVWLAQHGVLVVLGAFVLARADVEARRNRVAARGEALALAALALGLASASGHAAAITPGGASAVAVDAAHLLAAGLWVGALVPLALLLRAAGRADGADCRPYARRAARRFSRVALIAVLVLIGSGAMRAIAEIGGIAGLVGTPHGRLLLAKLALLVPILALAGVSRTRFLPALSAPDVEGRPALRRLAAFVALEAALALVVLALAAGMTLATPARHGDPTWPLPFRLSLEAVLDTPAAKARALLGGGLALAGLAAMIAAVRARRRRAPILTAALALLTVGAGVALPPLAVDAFPTTYRRPLVTYHAGSIAAGLTTYRERCASCHGADGAGDASARPPAGDLRAAPAARRSAGELYWLVTHGVPARGMPPFEARLDDAQRWNVINFIRALGAADAARGIGPQAEIDRAWLVAPDFAISVGPLAPGALRDYRGQRMVLLVLYTLPGSRARMAELAQSYNVLSIIGVEIVAVPTDGSPDAIAALGSSPPVLFPVVTSGAADIVATYRLFAPGPHAELLIDRQGYIRAIWRGDPSSAPRAAAVQSQVERLNEERSPPPFPDDHVH